MGRGIEYASPALKHSCTPVLFSNSTFHVKPRHDPYHMTASVSRIPPVTAVDILWLTGAIAQVTNIYQISVHALSGAEEPV